MAAQQDHVGWRFHPDRIQPFDLSTVSQPKRLHPLSQGIPASQRASASGVRSHSAGWQADYDRRAGIEGTLSQGIRAFGLRKCRYFGLAKTSLQEILAATAMNMIRAYY